MNESEQVSTNMVVSLRYTLSVDGEIIDATQTPIQFIHGHGRILPALERGLEGMTRGESRKIAIRQQDAYGEYDPQRVSFVSRDQFPPDFVFVLGARLNIRDKNWAWYDAAIRAIGPDTIELDLNHPLAGKDLLFDATVVDLRPASQDEVASGEIES